MYIDIAIRGLTYVPFCWIEKETKVSTRLSLSLAITLALSFSISQCNTSSLFLSLFL